MVNRLMEVGADPKAESKDGWTALHLAAPRGHVAMVNRLMEVGADPNHCSYFNITPLQRAVHHGRVEILQSLIRSSGNPWLVDGFGRNVLDWAYMYPPAFQAMAQFHRHYKPTDQTTILQHLAKTIQKLFQSTYREQSWLNPLGFFLLQVGEEIEATTAFEQYQSLGCTE
jgi:hypothetical protein